MPLYIDAYDPADIDEVRAANEANRIGNEMTAVLKGTGENQIAEIGVKDLKPGTYYLVETEAPAGYYMSEPVKIEVKVRTTMNNTVSQDTVDVTASIGGKPVAGDKLSHSESAWTLKIMNTAGYKLPSTGGPGTTLFYLMGMILTAGAAGILMRRRRCLV